MSFYRDKKRTVGNQSETPRFVTTDTHCVYGGYQRFDLYQDKIDIIKTDLLNKWNTILPYLKQHDRSCSLLDIGCSNGCIGFAAYFEQFRAITSLDHDYQYVNNVIEGIKYIGAEDHIKTMTTNVIDLTEKADIITMFAVIHWIYSCTADFGSVSSIVKFLRQRCNKTLFIEWVGPSDGAIKYFNHTSYNKSFHKEQYSKDIFINSMCQSFPYVKKLANITPHREIWVGSDIIFDGALPGYRVFNEGATANVLIDPSNTHVIKIYKNSMYLSAGSYDRELYWLKTLSALDVVPKILSHDDEKKIIVMTYVGERMTDSNRPDDFVDQCRHIVQQLKENNCCPVDIKTDEECLIQNGKVSVCDFGWCPNLDMDYTIGGLLPPVSKKILSWFVKANDISDV